MVVKQVLVRVIGEDQETVGSFLKIMRKVSKKVIVTGIKRNQRDPGYRGYAIIVFEVRD